MMRRRIVKSLVMSLVSSLFCGWAYGQDFTLTTQAALAHSAGRSTEAVTATVR